MKQFEKNDLLSSMTGYGRAIKQTNLALIQIDVKSLNNRYLEIRQKIPKNYQMWEQNIRPIVMQYAQRGSFDISLSLKSNMDKLQSLFSEKKIESIVNSIEKTAKTMNIPSGLSMVSLLSLPEIREWSEEQILSEQEEKNIFQFFDEVLHEAMTNLCKMRGIEGKKIQEFILRELMQIDLGRKNILKLLPEMNTAIHQKLKQRMELILKEFGLAPDESRLLQEVAFCADRSDITEELDRLSSHLEQFQQLLCNDGKRTKNSGLGKQLDFLIQEMNRETNTMNAKNNFIAFTPIFLEMKMSLERVREQIQNVE